MSIFLSYENISSVLVDRILPKLQTVRLVAKRDRTLDTERAVSIYEILELLVADGRLRRINLLGDVICLDVDSSRPEIPVMIALGSKSLIAAEGLHFIDKGIFTEATYLDLYAINALRKCQTDSANLITMFNAHGTFDKVQLLSQVARVLKVGGQFVIAGDVLMFFELSTRRQEGLVAGNYRRLGLVPSIPEDHDKPMGYVGYTFRSVLQQNVFGLTDEQLGMGGYIPPNTDPDTIKDGTIAVLEKI